MESYFRDRPVMAVTIAVGALLVLSLVFPRGSTARAQAVFPPRVALTFDDGYNYDRRIFEYLASQGIRATCFLIGHWMEKNPSLVREMADRGWEICNHTYHHAPLTKLPDDRIRWEISACQDVIRGIAGQDFPLVRPPGGFIDDRVRAVISSMGFTPVMWSMDSMDARSPAPPVPDRISHMVNHSRDGSILLFHLGGKGTYEMVTGVVEGLKRRGFVFVTVGELYGIKSVIRGGDVNQGISSPATTWYFAEGTTRRGFECWFSVFNPSRGDARVDFEFFTSRGKITRVYEVGQERRLTFEVKGELKVEEDFSCILRSDIPVVAERSLYFRRGGGMNGVAIGPGTSELSTRWIFPLGRMQERLEDYLILFNPGPEDAQVRLEFYGENGWEARRDVRFPAEVRSTVDIGRLLGASAATVVLDSDSPLAAERACYFGFEGGPGGSFLVPGLKEKREEWYFPEGTLRFGTVNRLNIFNPNSAANLVEVTLISGGDMAGEVLALDPWSASSIDVSRYLSGERDFSVRLRGLLPLVASRTSFFNDGNALGGAMDPGASAHSTRFFFAEGCTAGGYSEWLILFNSLERPAEAEVTYYLGERRESRRYQVNPLSRVTVNVGQEIGAEYEVSVEVNGEAGIYAERSLYFSRTFSD